MSYDRGLNADLLQFESALEDRIAASRERIGDALFDQILGPRKKIKKALTGTEHFETVKERRALASDGKAVGSDPVMKKRARGVRSWEMLQYDCGDRISCQERSESELIYSNIVDTFLSRYEETIDNSGDKLLFSKMTDATNNTVVDFQASFGNALPLGTAASLWDDVLQGLTRQHIARPDFVFLTLDVFQAAQKHPNQKETSSFFLGSGAMAVSPTIQHIADLLKVDPSRVFVDNTPVLVGNASDDTQQNYGSTNFMYIATNDHIRLYESDCSDTLTTEEKHIWIEWMKQRTFDISIDSDVQAGVLINNIL